MIYSSRQRISPKMSTEQMCLPITLDEAGTIKPTWHDLGCRRCQSLFLLAATGTDCVIQICLFSTIGTEYTAGHWAKTDCAYAQEYDAFPNTFINVCVCVCTSYTFMVSRALRSMHVWRIKYLATLF